jgi:hypothetical protein
MGAVPRTHAPLKKIYRKNQPTNFFRFFWTLISETSPPVFPQKIFVKFRKLTENELAESAKIFQNKKKPRIEIVFEKLTDFNKNL